MEQTLLEKSVLTGELQLTFWQKEGHYFSVVLLGAMALLLAGFILYDTISYGFQDFRKDLLTVCLICVALSWIFYHLQKHRLKLKRIKTSLPIERKLALIFDLAEKLEWRLYFYEEGKAIVFKTDPSIWSGSWGEHITIIFTDQGLLANSICDIDKQPSVVSFGRNQSHLKALIEHIGPMN